jgi:HlyD family secretion protein
MLLVDTSEFYVDLGIDETDVVKLEIGQGVEFAFDALPDVDITGHVARIGASPTIIGQLVTYPVRVALDSRDEASAQAVRVGMSVTATVIVDELQNVLIVPNRFIRIDRATQAAFVTIPNANINGRYSEIPVKLGLRNELDSQITGGLEAGQRIVLLPRSSFELFGG